MKVMKTLSKIIALVLTLALVCAAPVLGVAAAEGSSSAEGTNPAEADYDLNISTHLEGTPLSPNFEDSPALQGDIRIPLLEEAPTPIEPTNEPETFHIPAPHTGRSSSLGAVLGGGLLLGSAWLLAGRRSRQNYN